MTKPFLMCHRCCNDALDFVSNVRCRPLVPVPTCLPSLPESAGITFAVSRAEGLLVNFF